MFYISDFYNVNKGQFEPFKNERGKLPSFSICIRPLVNKKINHLTERQQLGDYTFYEETSEGVWFSFCGSYLCLNKNMKQADVYLSKNLRFDGQYETSNLIMQAFMYRLVDMGNFMIHSAATVFENQGILFCGQSGAGKSTQANLWKKHLKTKIINYDKPCIINDNGTFYAHGSPWSGKEELYLNEFVPLKAIVFVRQANENRVVKLSPAQACAHIYLHNYVYPITNKIEEKYASAINEVVKKIPVYELYCDISENAVEVLYNELFQQSSYEEYKKELIVKYKVKDNFLMNKIADEYVVIPRGTEALDFNATVVFNESGAFLWDLLQDFKDIDNLADALAQKYDISIKVAQDDCVEFIKKMQNNKLLDVIE
ncbi:MAG: PqqD family peptide modification chaperone [Ruminococcus sp.]|nr:PqqD family peptide modification chaperone [Ruminococcus sp.]